MRAHVTDGTLRIPKLNRITILWTEAIPQYESRNTELVQPLCDVCPFIVERQVLVTASWHNDHGRRNLVRRIRQVLRQRRAILWRIALGSGRSVWPQWNDLMLRTLSD